MWNFKLVGVFVFVGFLFYMNNINFKYFWWSYGEGFKDMVKLFVVIDCFKFERYYSKF